MVGEAARLQHAAGGIDQDLNGHIGLDLGTPGLGRVAHWAA